MSDTLDFDTADFDVANDDMSMAEAAAVQHLLDLDQEGLDRKASAGSQLAIVNRLLDQVVRRTPPHLAYRVAEQSVVFSLQKVQVEVYWDASDAVHRLRRVNGEHSVALRLEFGGLSCLSPVGAKMSGEVECPPLRRLEGVQALSWAIADAFETLLRFHDAPPSAAPVVVQSRPQTGFVGAMAKRRDDYLVAGLNRGVARRDASRAVPAAVHITESLAKILDKT